MTGEASNVSLIPLIDPKKVNVPKDSFHLAYIVYFTLGLGFLLPWNTFITAVDYFAYLYPLTSVDRTFSVFYMISSLAVLFLIICFANMLSGGSHRINSGLGLFLIALLVVPVVDWAWVKGERGVYGAFDATVAAVTLSGVADALAQSGIIGSAGQMPERYMQAVFAGTAASGVLVSAMRIITKSIYPQDADGLRKSANLYFAVSIIVMVMCVICYNIAHKLPVVQYYVNLKNKAVKEEKSEKDLISRSNWRTTLWNIFGIIKWNASGVYIIYLVTLSIFPGYITEDVHSTALKDWYPVILIAGYNIFDLVGKSLTAAWLLENDNIAVLASFGRLLFYPLFLGCLHGPEIFRTELPVVVLTCLLGLTNGYLTSVLMILTPKKVPIQHSESAGIVMVMFLGLGLASGSVVSWFWVI